MLEFKEIFEKEDLLIVEKLANEILHDTYDGLMPTFHIDFLIQSSHTEKVIHEQIKKENHEFYLLSWEGKNIGYLGIEYTKKKIMLSKLYVLKAYQGKGIGKKVLYFVENKVEDSVNLIVQKQNENAYQFYLKNGYSVVREFNNTFENGHTLQGYLMSKKKK